MMLEKVAVSESQKANFLIFIACTIQKLIITFLSSLELSSLKNNQELKVKIKLCQFMVGLVVLLYSDLVVLLLFGSDTYSSMLRSTYVWFIIFSAFDTRICKKLCTLRSRKSCF